MEREVMTLAEARLVPGPPLPLVVELTFFNVSTLDPGVARALLSMGKENLPNNTYYGDGAELEPEVLDELRAAYEAETVALPWQEGDIMMLDNMLVAHGREAYKPPRQIVVGMAEPWSRSGAEPKARLGRG